MVAPARPRSNFNSSSPALVAPAPRHRHAHTPRDLRRRRVVATLAALAVVAAVIGLITGDTAAWWAAALAVSAGLAFGALLLRMRHVAARRELDRTLHAGCPDTLDDLLALRDLHLGDGATAGSDDFGVAPPQAESRGALLRFLLADTAGWVLAPALFGLDLLLRRTPADSTGQRWLHQLRHAQDQVHDKSLRALAVGAVTTAGVTAGSAVGLAGSAGAAPVVSTSVAAVAPASLAALVTSATSYTVVAGDTLSSIAARHGTTVEALASQNDISDPNFIMAGQVLTIDGSAPTTSAAPASGGSYTVRAGDTLGAIASRYGTTAANLAALN
ncbi:MAG: LysM peptidoglycan-binding domain-containing protein, partial [Acidimicrobiales bacterium]